MMGQRGLSYEQGPAFGVPLRLFQLAPLFLMAASFAGIVLANEWHTGRWSPATLALTHFLTLGYLGSIMQGALLQMLPVVLGSPVPRAAVLSCLGLYGLGIGTPVLAAGLLWGESLLLWIAAGAMAVAWLPFLAGLTLSLARSQTGGEMDTPIRFSGFAMALTVLTGLSLAGGLTGLWPLSNFTVLVDTHAGWGLIGWISMLIVGVAYQVVPMLQLTPSYPSSVTHALSWLLPGGLTTWTIASWFDSLAFLRPIAAALICAGCALFVGATMHLQWRRRRKFADVTLGFWRIGLVSLAVAIIGYLCFEWLPESVQDAANLSVGLLFLIGFAASAVNGMLYKIVPFLAWFHLQSQTRASAGSIPNMRQMIDETATRHHMHVHLAAVCLLAPAPFFPPGFAVPGLLALAWSAHMLWLNIREGRARYISNGGHL